jgi:hypothetical protein
MKPHRHRSILHEVHDVLALPDCPVFVPNRHSYGAIWDPAEQDIVAEALTGVHGLPERQDAEIDQAWLRKVLEGESEPARTLEEPCIFGGVLVRHFGHFCHEGLSRLWWLGSADSMPAPLQSAAKTLQALQSNVWFFMPPWLDQGKDLLAYMEEILAGLGMEPGRVRIISEPIRFRHLLIPFQPWGFDVRPSQVEETYGCDSLQLMRHLLAGYVPSPLRGMNPPEKYSTTSAQPTSPAQSQLRVFVSRSALPLDQGRLIGDVILDQVLAEAGFLVFHPENHSITDQITLYSAANELVFIDGSSLYLLWFSHLKPGATIKVILRRRQGLWMTERIHDLLPDAASLRWEVIDALMAEGLTCDQDWLSHNLGDLRNVLTRILGQAPPSLSHDTREALKTYAMELVTETEPTQQAAVLEALLEAMVTAPHRLQASRRTFLKLRLKSLGRRFKRWARSIALVPQASR